MSKVKQTYILLLLSLFILTISSCKKNSTDNPSETEKDINELVISPNFDFKTDAETIIEITAYDNSDQPLSGVRFDIYTDISENNGKRIISGITGGNGVFSATFNLAADMTQLVARTNYLGMPNEVVIPVVNHRASVKLGGKPVSLKSGELNFKTTNASWYPMGTWNNQGVPNYLVNPNDVVDPQFLNDVNASFPESKPVPLFHPEYLAPENEQDFKLNEFCDVWVTFVHEGAGYKNVLLYYTYDLDNPPTNPNQIDSLHIVFPNVSYYNSGGGLYSGNKVYLGQFQGGQAIGFAIIANGYNGTTVTGGNGIFYSDPNLNPESNASKKQHSVVLLDNGRDIFLMGFEDINRMVSSCDNDFNDVMFIVKANPIASVQTGGFAPITNTLPDTDDDGVADQFDDYPNDPDKAFNNYYPGEGLYGTLAFEDLWPGKGDYDFNDVVIDYNINQITNANNNVVQIKPRVVVKAIGASYKNGFGFQLGSNPSAVASVTGQVLNHNLVTLNANGTEAGQNKAVIIVSDNVYDILPYPGGGFTGVNVIPEAPWVQPDTVDLVIDLAQPVPVATMGLPPYNPFIFVDQNRSVEVHLPDYEPTNLHNSSLFGTSHDDSDPASGRYYKTSNNLPWALNIVQNFAYPIEKRQIVTGYLKFATWAESSGSQFPNWPVNQSGYRNESNIYSR